MNAPTFVLSKKELVHEKEDTKPHHWRGQIHRIRR